MGADKIAPVEDLLLPIANPQGPLAVYGSSDGWLCLKDEDDKEIYLVPASTYQKRNGKIYSKDTKKPWTMLGDFYIAEE
jgi:hypothetical protein